MTVNEIKTDLDNSISEFNNQLQIMIEKLHKLKVDDISLSVLNNRMDKLIGLNEEIESSLDKLHQIGNNYTYLNELKVKQMEIKSDPLFPVWG